MRGIAVVSAMAIVALVPFSAAAQDKFAVRAPRVGRGTPVVAVAPAISDADTADDTAVAARRFAEQLSERLRPIEQRLRDDARLRRAGAVIGLRAAAIGAFRGQEALTFVGPESLRLGLGRHVRPFPRGSGLRGERSNG